MNSGGYATAWRDVAPRGPRALARGVAVSALSAATQVTGQMRSLLRRPRVQILLLHHVFEDEQDRFRQLLQWLSRDHTLIDYSDACRRAESGGAEIDRPYVAVTFDDGLKNCMTAARIMREFGARGCFFVCPGIVGETNQRKIAEFCDQRLELAAPVEFMNWDDLCELHDQGNEIGAHTMTHPRLTAVSPVDADREIADSFDSISRRLGRPRHFAWTYGRFQDFSAELARTAYACGFETCASGARGCHGPSRTDSSVPLCIRRDHLVAAWPISHAAYFLMKASKTAGLSAADWPPGWAERLKRSSR